MTAREFREALAAVEDRSLTIRDLLLATRHLVLDDKFDLDELRWAVGDGPKLIPVSGNVPSYETDDGRFFVRRLQGEMWDIEENRDGGWVHFSCAYSLTEARHLIGH